MSGTAWDYESIKAYSRETGRPAGTLIALARDNDPFFIGPARQAEAGWFAELWRGIDLPQAHYRRIFYRLISLAEPVVRLDGTPFENTYKCWGDLCTAARDAVALSLVPDDAFVDRRNNQPFIRIREPADAETYVSNAECKANIGNMPELPALSLYRPSIPQRYHVELWAEKTTVNDVLEPLANHYALNVITGVGELSATACREFVERAITSGRPARILYISDFDPAGQSMPVAVARKIEHELCRRGLDLDVQVRPVVLTKEQCDDYRLPRTPLKETERRAAGFEERFGEGATELDALEAIYPGLLRRILVQEIQRYWDSDLAEQVDDAGNRIQGELDEITERVHEEHKSQIDALREEWRKIEELLEAWMERARPAWQAVRGSLSDAAPDTGEFEWPEPALGDEDPDPLFDSRRDYVTQIDHYKEHQEKPTERRERTDVIVTCAGCGKTFPTKSRLAKFCGGACRSKAYHTRKGAA